MNTMRILDYGFVCSVFKRPHETMIKIATPKVVLLPNVDVVRISSFVFGIPTLAAFEMENSF
jgi:hypothetical protein